MALTLLRGQAVKYLKIVMGVDTNIHIIVLQILLEIYICTLPARVGGGDQLTQMEQAHL